MEWVFSLYEHMSGIQLSCTTSKTNTPYEKMHDTNVERIEILEYMIQKYYEELIEDAKHIRLSKNYSVLFYKQLNIQYDN